MQMRTNIKDMRDNIDALNGLFHFLRNKNHIKKHVYENLDVIDDFVKNAEILIAQKEEQDRILADLSLRHELVSELLAAQVQNKGVMMFHETLNGDYMEFANADDTLANEAEIFLQLQNIEKELSIIAACPELYQKNIIAVGGGFSAGKSEFISSFMDSGIKLPISIEPTTAIPAYVMNAPKEYLLGYSKNGGAVDLRKIDKNFHARLNHDFMKGFKFNLKEILPFIVLGTKLKFENICFIDTPGYNPSGNIANYGADVDTAKEFLEEAGVFLWLVGLDSTGTMPSGDLEFLSSLDLENKKLYVVINKADLRAPSDLEAITETVKQSLDNYGINYEGIQTFSSIRTLQNPCIVGKSLDEFLAECNTPSQKHVEIFNKLKNIYQAYQGAIKGSIKEKKSIQKTLHSISVDMLEDGLEDMGSNAYTKLGELKSAFGTKKEEENLKLLKVVMDEFKEAVKTVFGLDEVVVDFDETYHNNKTSNAVKGINIDNNEDKNQNEHNESIERLGKQLYDYKEIIRQFKEFIDSSTSGNDLDDNALLNMLYEMARKTNISQSQCERFINDFMDASDQKYISTHTFVRENLIKRFDEFKNEIDELTDSVKNDFPEKVCNKFRKNILRNLSKFESYLDENYKDEAMDVSDFWDIE
jgi:hypothetical protein